MGQRRWRDQDPGKAGREGGEREKEGIWSSPSDAHNPHRKRGSNAIAREKEVRGPKVGRETAAYFM